VFIIILLSYFWYRYYFRTFVDFTIFLHLYFIQKICKLQVRIFFSFLIYVLLILNINYKQRISNCIVGSMPVTVESRTHIRVLVMHPAVHNFYPNIFKLVKQTVTISLTVGDRL